MSTNYPGSLDSYSTKVDGVDDVMAAHINNPQDAIEALEAYSQTMSLIKVRNTSGATVAANDVGHINVDGEFKSTTTAYHHLAWAVVISGAANNSDIIVARRGRVTIALNGNCSAGDYLYTSTTTGQAQPQTYVRTEVLGVALTANASGAGGTCVAVLLCHTDHRPVTPTNDVYKGNPLSISDFVATIATLPGGAVLTYNAPSSGDEVNLVPTSTSQIGKMVLHNTTRSNDALILNNVVGTNTTTLTAAVPGTWQVGDTITIRSQTNTALPVAGCYFIDFEITSGLVTLARYLVAYQSFRDSGAAQIRVWLHPYEADAVSKRKTIITQVANVAFDWTTPPIPLSQNRFCMAWNASGGSTINNTLRAQAQGVAAP